MTSGDLLWEEFPVPMGITKYRLAKEIHGPAQRIGDIIAIKRSIAAYTDLRLCRFVGTIDGDWPRAQVAYDTDVGRDVHTDEVASVTPWSAA